jgi:oxalate decarboxylase/phosphoglucose isomerase-like protein (cupin superfamily)
MAVEWAGGTFEFGAGDIVYLPGNRWHCARVTGDEAVQMFYVMDPPPAWIWSRCQGVSQMGDLLEPTAERL